MAVPLIVHILLALLSGHVYITVSGIVTYLASHRFTHATAITKAIARGKATINRNVSNR
jgi:hypothetical protein